MLSCCPRCSVRSISSAVATSRKNSEAPLTTDPLDLRSTSGAVLLDLRSAAGGTSGPPERGKWYLWTSGARPVVLLDLRSAASGTSGSTERGQWYFWTSGARPVVPLDLRSAASGTSGSPERSQWYCRRRRRMSDLSAACRRRNSVSGRYEQALNHRRRPRPCEPAFPQRAASEGRPGGALRIGIMVRQGGSWLCAVCRCGSDCSRLVLRCSLTAAGGCHPIGL